MSRPPSRATMILAQVFISMMMAFLMTLIFTAIPMQFSPGWVGAWLGRFIRAWPIAFALSLVIGPLAFRMARAITATIEKHSSASAA